MKDRKCIDTLQALRCLAFLGVFLCHTGLPGMGSLGVGGVSIFLVLSGFVMTYSYYGGNRVTSISIGDNIKFAYNRIKKLYPLYALTTVFLALLFFVGRDTAPVGSTLLRLGFNFLFVQEYTLHNVSINGPAWFMCVIVLFYFLFPWILKMMENNYSRRKAVMGIMIGLIMDLIIGLIGSTFDSMSYGVDLTWRFVYFFPLSRIWDTFIGCNLGYLYLNRKQECSKGICTLLEIITIIVFIAANVIYNLMKSKWKAGYVNSTDVWWIHSLLFIVCSIMFVYIFAIGKGVISNVLVNKVTLYLAKISPYAYLLHYAVFHVVTMVIYHLPGVNDEVGRILDHQYGSWLKLTVGFAITVILSELWIRISKLRQHT